MPKEVKPKRRAADKSQEKPKGSSKGGPKETKGSKGLKGPKRPLSAYMFFSQDWRERIKAENPDAGFGELGKLLGAKWKELDEDEKKPYLDMAAKDKARAEEEKASMASKPAKDSKDSGEEAADAADEDEE